MKKNITQFSLLGCLNIELRLANISFGTIRDDRRGTFNDRRGTFNDRRGTFNGNTIRDHKRCFCLICLQEYFKIIKRSLDRLFT